MQIVVDHTDLFAANAAHREGRACRVRLVRSRQARPSRFANAVRREPIRVLFSLRLCVSALFKKRISVIGPVATILGQTITIANNVIRMSSALSALTSSFSVPTKKLSFLGDWAKRETTPKKNQQPSRISISHRHFKMNKRRH